MPHSDETFYKMRCGWAGDPKVATLERFGAVDACLARDLFSQMIDYARRELTDGLVPRGVLPGLMWPLPAEDALRLATHLADHGAFGPLVEWDTGSSTNGSSDGSTAGNTPGSTLRILAYAKWNDTRAEVQARKERGSKAIRTRWDRRDAEGDTASNTGSSTESIHRARAQVDTEQEQEQDKPSPVQHRSTVPARTTSAEDEDSRTEFEHAVVAVMASAGHTVTRAEAARLITLTLAGHRPRDPRAYVMATLKKDPAAAKRLVASPHQPPPPSPEALRRADELRHGIPEAELARRAEVSHAGAAAARAGLAKAAVAEAPAPPPEPPADEDW